MNHLPPGGKRRKLDPSEIRALVEAVDAGRGSPANLEKTGSVWRLRLTIDKPTGGSIRRGITVRDEATAKWIEDYLKTARTGWREDCRKAREKTCADAN
jgi:hypothetical protein